MNAALSGLCAVIACLIVLGLAAAAVHVVFGQFEYIIYAVLGFFALMGLMAKVNAR